MSYKTKKNNYSNQANNYSKHANNYSKQANNYSNPANHLNSKVLNWKKRREIKNKIKLIIEEFYETSKIFKISPYSYLYGVNKDISVQFNILTRETSNNPSKICLTLDFNHSKKKLSINELNKCSINGAINLINAIKIAKKLEYNTISLGDYSEINGNYCSYSLKIFNILLNGESWYNKYGLKSEAHEREQKEIIKIRNKSFIKNIDKFMEKYNKQSKDYYVRQKNKLIIKNVWMSLQYIQTMYSINIKYQTKTVFKQLDIYRKKLKKDDEKDMFICVLGPIIELFNGNITYDTSLSAHPSEFDY